MADSGAIARIRANALRDLKEIGPQIAAQVGIEAPNLDFSFKDKDYQQAQELTVLADFNKRLLTALQTQSQGSDDAQRSDTKIPQSRSSRAAVSKR
jgi:hypothetical protein